IRAPPAAWRRRVASTAPGSTGRTTGSTGPRGSARPAPGVARQPQMRALDPGSRSVASAASAPRAARLTTTHAGGVPPRDWSAGSPGGITLTCRPPAAAAAHAGSSSTTTMSAGACLVLPGPRFRQLPPLRQEGARVRHEPRDLVARPLLARGGLAQLGRELLPLALRGAQPLPLALGGGLGLGEPGHQALDLFG